MHSNDVVVHFQKKEKEEESGTNKKLDAHLVARLITA